MNPGILLIRADANAAIGTGHVMRCLALAQGWQDAGGDVVLVAAELPDAVKRRLIAEQIEVIRSQTAPGTEQDATELASLAVARRAAWVALDGERFNPEYFQTLKNFQQKILWLDDFGSATLHACDLILNQNRGATRESYPWFCDEARLLLGTEYVTLRREFRIVTRKTATESSGAARNLLVTFGGSDPENMTEKVLRAIAAHPPGINVTTVVGAGNPKLARLLPLAESLGVTFLSDPPNMPELMTESDLGLIVAGGTLWELLYCGCAILSYSRNSVQANVIAQLAEAGAVENLGSADAFDAEALCARIRYLGGSATERQKMRAAGRRVVDGEGVSRVVRALNGE